MAPRLFCTAHCYSSLLLFSILFGTLISLTHARTHLHAGPTHGQNQKILRGRAKTRTPPADRSGGHLSDTPSRVVKFACHIKKDVLIWDELARDGVKFDACSFKSGDKLSRVRLSGSKLDLTDFQTGVIFTIEKGDFELSCRKPFAPVPGIDSSDNILFYKILKKTVLGPHSVALVMKLIPGRFVVPEVDVSVGEGDDDPHGEDFEIYDEDYMPHSTQRAVTLLQTNETLPVLSRFTSFQKTINLDFGAVLEVDAGVSARFFNFKVVRLLSLEFRWEQTLDAYVRATLDIQFAFRKNLQGEFARYFIPGLSFKAGIPLVGSLEAGAFVGLNYVVELQAAVSLKAVFNANYRRHEEVTARIFSPSFDAVNKLPIGSGVSGDANLVIGESTADFDGFAGVRPVVGVGLKYTRTKVSFRRFRLRITKETDSVDGTLGASIGLKLGVDFTSPPFPPYGGKQLNLICSACHHIRANLRFQGKDLSVQLVASGTVRSEKVIVSTLFDLDIGTVCFWPC